MPKKTKKDKILAKQRRSSSPTSVSRENPTAETNFNTSLYSFTSSAEKKIQHAVAEYSSELGLIKRDLYKTIALAIIAFGVILYLYWLLSR